MIGVDVTRNKYLEHARQNQMIQKYKTEKETLEMPVCPKCERVGFRDKGWRTHQRMACPHCHYTGPTTMVLRAYLKQGMYK